jgi:hypothetical protein
VLPRVRTPRFRPGGPDGPVGRQEVTVAKAFDKTPAKRVEAEKLVQSGEAAVSIDLSRADACVHIEQAYVTSVMTQAEAHRRRWSPQGIRESSSSPSCRAV